MRATDPTIAPLCVGSHGGPDTFAETIQDVGTRMDGFEPANSNQTPHKKEKKEFHSMKMYVALFATAILSSGAAPAAAAQQSLPRVPDQLKVNIDTQQAADPVSKYIFGGFIEHIGTTIYRSLWAELLDDRKFYFPISSTDPQTAARPQGNPMRTQLRKWRPIGPDGAVVMDPDRPFVGDHSPKIQLDPSTPHGIRQTGFTLVNGKQYTGRMYLRGTPGTKVNVSLVWGSGDKDRETVAFTLTSEYKKFPLRFTSKADSSAGSLEIAATGSGDFHVGTVSLMPADNVEGFRPDTIALLKQQHQGMWRLPGGNFLSDWVWYDAIGDIDKRPPMFDHAWNAMQVNDVGMDEFMTLCKLIDVDPYVTVNAGLGDSHSAAEEVEYLNGAASTHMGAQRARNGHPEPYHVRYWNIGNEPWGDFQIGYTDLKYYVIKNNEFAKAMRKADPSITLIASGKMLEPTWLKGADRAKYVDNLGPMFGSDIDWTGGLLAKCWGTFDGIAQHWYEGPGRHFDVNKAKALPANAPNEGAYVSYNPTTLEYARYAGDVVRRHAEEWEGYQKRFPQMVARKIFLSIDEYSYGGRGGGPNLKSALAYGMLLDETMRHTDFLTMAARTMGTSGLDITPTAATYNAVGLVYKLYGEHFPGTIPVTVSGNSPQPPGNPSYADEPKNSSGSPTYPLDIIATLTPDRKYLNVAVVNATDQEQKFDLSVTGVHVTGPSMLWQITGSSLDAANRVGQPAEVAIKEISIGAPQGGISVAPISVNVYRFGIAQ
jgi:alpha-N-arabinofuranosidase